MYLSFIENKTLNMFILVTTFSKSATETSVFASRCGIKTNSAQPLGTDQLKSCDVQCRNHDKSKSTSPIYENIDVMYYF